MNEIYKVQMFVCVILMSWIMSNCTSHFVAQVISSTINVILIMKK